MEIIWSPQSLDDIEQIGDYIAEDSTENATNFVLKIIDSVERLKKFPESGSLIEENPMFRHVICQRYRIIYYLESNNINIITVLSPGRLLKL